MNARHATLALGLGLLIALPSVTPPYFMHLLIQILLWGFIYTAWSMMGRFGFVSLGHGAFMGVGAYVPALLWNYYDLTPWIGIPLGVVLSVLLALIIGYPCFRLRVVGHYFALVTLALSQVVLLSLQYDVHPFIGNTFGPLIFMICVLGGLGDMIGGFIAAFVISQIISIGGYYANTELSYVLAFTFFIVLMFVRPRGIFAR